MPRSNASLDIVIIGLALTSSWGNGHATTYRSLIKGLARRGHRVTFLERDQPWYAQHRDQPQSEHCDTQVYSDVEDLQQRFGDAVRDADVAIVGSYVNEGRRVCEWVLQHSGGIRAFYDIDTPVTLSGMRENACAYLAVDQIREFDLMLSFTGGPTLNLLEQTYGAKRASALYCSVDIDAYRPQQVTPHVALGYMGTYSDDRQPGLEAFLNTPARALPELQFMVVGPQYPTSIQWPANVRRVEHLPPRDHPQFYASQRFTLNLTRADMRAAGYSPSVRLFEAAACGTPIISDDWPGLSALFRPNDEIVIVHESKEVIECLCSLDEVERGRLARNARARVLAEHSSVCRAMQLEQYINELDQPRQRRAQLATATG